MFELQGELRGLKAEGVARLLGTAIQEGRFVPGQRLVEADLTAELGISRSLLREALRSLSAEGAIDLIPNRGAMVRRLSRRETMELFEIRAEMEALAARLAAGRIADPEVRETFEHATASLADARPRLSARDYLAENQQFHAAIFAAAGNLELARLNRRMQLSLIMAQISAELTPEAIAASLREHRRMADAIRAGDAAEADAAARAHLARARNFAESLPSRVYRA